MLRRIFSFISFVTIQYRGESHTNHHWSVVSPMTKRNDNDGNHILHRWHWNILYIIFSTFTWEVILLRGQSSMNSLSPDNTFLVSSTNSLSTIFNGTYKLYWNYLAFLTKFIPGTTIHPFFTNLGSFEIYIFRLWCWESLSSFSLHKSLPELEIYTPQNV